jgi:hypothetical protein
MMNMIVLLAIAGFVGFELLAARFGADSRPGFDERPELDRRPNL